MKLRLKHLLPLLLITVGCTSKNDSINISALIMQRANACKTVDCSVDIKALTPFEWDELYVFNLALPQDKIERAIGMDYPDYKPNTCPMIFVYKNKIVHAENEPYILQKGVKAQVVFNYPLGLSFNRYIPANVNFKIKADGDTVKKVYTLYQ